MHIYFLNTNGFQGQYKRLQSKVYEWLQEKEQLKEMTSFKTDASGHTILRNKVLLKCLLEFDVFSLFLLILA